MTAPSVFPLDPIETASRDELQALQLQRLQWSLNHASEHSPHYRKTFDAAGVHRLQHPLDAEAVAGQVVGVAGSRPGVVVRVDHHRGQASASLVLLPKAASTISVVITSDAFSGLASAFAAT